MKNRNMPSMPVILIIIAGDGDGAMRRLGAFAILLVMLAVPGQAARAQHCTTPVTSWQTSYTLRAIASGSVACGSGGRDTCTVDHSSSATGFINTFNWRLLHITDLVHGLGYNLPTTVSLADSISSPCLLSGLIVQRFGQPTNGYTSEILTLDLAANTYSFEPDATSAATDQITDCDGNVSSEAVPVSLLPGTARQLAADIHLAGHHPASDSCQERLLA